MARPEHVSPPPQETPQRIKPFYSRTEREVTGIASEGLLSILHINQIVRRNLNRAPRKK